MLQKGIRKEDNASFNHPTPPLMPFSLKNRSKSHERRPTKKKKDEEEKTHKEKKEEENICLCISIVWFAKKWERIKNEKKNENRKGKKKRQWLGKKE